MNLRKQLLVIASVLALTWSAAASADAQEDAAVAVLSYYAGLTEVCAYEPFPEECVLNYLGVGYYAAGIEYDYWDEYWADAGWQAVCVAYTPNCETVAYWRSYYWWVMYFITELIGV